MQASDLRVASPTADRAILVSVGQTTFSTSEAILKLSPFFDRLLNSPCQNNLNDRKAIALNFEAHEMPITHKSFKIWLEWMTMEARNSKPRLEREFKKLNPAERDNLFQCIRFTETIDYLSNKSDTLQKWAVNEIFLTLIDPGSVVAKINQIMLNPRLFSYNFTPELVNEIGMEMILKSLPMWIRGLKNNGLELNIGQDVNLKTPIRLSTSLFKSEVKKVALLTFQKECLANLEAFYCFAPAITKIPAYCFTELKDKHLQWVLSLLDPKVITSLDLRGSNIKSLDQITTRFKDVKEINLIGCI